MKLNVKRVKAPLIIKLTLSGVFLAIYMTLSLSLLNSERERGAGYHDNDLYFQADSEDFAKRVAKEKHTYDRVRFHPLFVLFFNPIGSSLNAITDNPEVSSCILNALVGGIGIYLTFVLFYQGLRVSLLRATLYTLITGFTSTHFVFSIVPDTFIFSSLGLTLLLIIALRRQSLAYWIGASVYIAGVTISNAISAFLVAYFYLFRRDNRLKINLSLAYRYGAGIMLVSVVLSVAQRILYHVWITTGWRAIPEQDFGWYLFIPHSLTEGWERLSLLLKHVFLFCIVPPKLKLTVHFLNPKLNMATFMETAWWDFPVASWAAALLWIFLLGAATYYLFKRRLYRHRLVKLSLLVILFNISLHLFYGDDFLLFSSGWLIFLLLMVFFILEQSPFVRKYARLYHVGLVVFVVSMGAAAARLAYDMYHILLSQ